MCTNEIQPIRTKVVDPSTRKALPLFSGFHMFSRVFVLEVGFLESEVRDPNGWGRGWGA